MFKLNDDKVFDIDSFLIDLQNGENNYKSLSSGTEREAYKLLFDHFYQKPMNNSKKQLCEVIVNYFVYDDENELENFIHNFLTTFLLYNNGKFYIWEKKWIPYDNLKEKVSKYFHITQNSHYVFHEIVDYIDSFNLDIIMKTEFSLDLKPSQINRFNLNEDQ